MKKVSIYCVTYNSYKELDNYLRSLDAAASKVAAQIQIDVTVADNTTDNIISPDCSVYANINVHYLSFRKNLGYMGAAQKAMHEVSPFESDYVVISNVDLVVSEDFFVSLLSLSVPSDTGWINTAIYSELEKRNRNPKLNKRYSLKRLRILKTMFRYPLLHYIYTCTAYRRKRYVKKEIPDKIYAGHGSFMLFTREFISRCGIPSYPVFLFGEEIYLAELCRINGLRVIYEPSLEVYDKEHCSTSSMKKSFYYRCNYEALDYIIRTFY